MTPEATLACIEERLRADITLAWTTAMLHRAKEFPRSPDELWGGPERGEGQGGTEFLVAMAKARMQQKEKQKPGTPASE